MSARVVESGGVLGGRGTGRSTLTALTQRREGEREEEKRRGKFEWE